MCDNYYKHSFNDGNIDENEEKRVKKLIHKANSLLSKRYKQIRPLTKEEVISQLPLLGFMDCEDNQLSQICSDLISSSRLLVYYKNDVIINEGELSNGIYVILNGLVSFTQQQHPYQLYHNDESVKSMKNVKSVKSIRDDKDYIDLFTYPTIYTLDNSFNNIIHESTKYNFIIKYRDVWIDVLYFFKSKLLYSYSKIIQSRIVDYSKIRNI